MHDLDLLTSNDVLDRLSPKQELNPGDLDLLGGGGQTSRLGPNKMEAFAGNGIDRETSNETQDKRRQEDLSHRFLSRQRLVIARRALYLITAAINTRPA